MASILLLGDCIPIALRLAQEGHICKMWFKDKAKTFLEGYKNPSRVQDPRKMLDQYDLILASTSGSGGLCDELKEKDKLVLGGGVFNDKLELDSDYVKKVQLSLLKLNLGESLEGIEISTEGWFDGHRWVQPFNHSFKQRRLMEGDKGPLLDSMGDVLLLTEGDKLTETLLIPLTDLLLRVNYIGPLTVSCILSQEVYSVRFMPRFNYDSIQALSELLKDSLFNFLYSIALGEGQIFQHNKDLGIAVRLSVNTSPKGEKFLQVPDEAKKHVWFSDVMKNKEDEELCAGGDGILGCVTARGETLRECKRRVYRTIQNIVIDKDVQYRQDIGEGVELKISTLKEQGWLA